MLREGEAGAKVADLCRKYGMSDAVYYNRKAKYAGLTVSELKRLKALEEENRRLKQIVAEQALDNRALKEITLKKLLKPRVKRLAVSHVRESLGLSERKACFLVNMSPSVYRYNRSRITMVYCVSACGSWRPRGSGLAVRGCTSC